MAFQQGHDSYDVDEPLKKKPIVLFFWLKTD